MGWWLSGVAVVCLALGAGVAVVLGLIAFHELRASASRLALRRTGRRARTDLFEAYRQESELADQQPWQGDRPVGAVARRADPGLLYDVLEARLPRAVPGASPPPDTAAGRVKPPDLMPLTA